MWTSGLTIVLLLVLLLADSGATGGTDTADDDDKVSVIIKNPLVAAIDSNVTFYAWVNDTRVNTSKPSYYSVLWTDSTQILPIPSPTKTYEGHTNFTKPYQDVVPGIYSMTATVYDGSDILFGPKIATRTVSFTLTDSLNGWMSLNQDWWYKRQGAIVSSEAFFSLSLNLTDVFTWRQVNTSWTINNISYPTGTPLQLNNILIPEEGHYIAEVTVTADVKVEKTILKKFGNFSKRFEVADPINDIYLNGMNLVALKEKTDLNITFSGSLPVSACMKIQKYRNRMPPSNDTCRYTLYNNTRGFPVVTSFNEVGTYQITAIIVNRISNETGYFYIQVYDRDHQSPIYIVLPLVFSMIGILIIIIAAMVLVRYQKQPFVETADFGFHIHDVQKPSWLSRIIIKVKAYVRYRWRKRRLNVNNIEEEFPTRSRRNSTSSYGSMCDTFSDEFSRSGPPTDIKSSYSNAMNMYKASFRNC